MKLCIDPGHGMSNRAPGVYDPGAISAGLHEADVALMWALTGKHIAREFPEVEVFLTRDDVRDHCPVGRRDDFARGQGATHFLSLHCNAALSGAATGIEVYYRDQVDKEWASNVLETGHRVMGIQNRGLKKESQSQHRRLAVLDFGPPACLLELGFITNEGDRGRMLDRDRRVRFWNELFERAR